MSDETFQFHLIVFPAGQGYLDKYDGSGWKDYTGYNSGLSEYFIVMLLGSSRYFVIKILHIISLMYAFPCNCKAQTDP